MKKIWVSLFLVLCVAVMVKAQDNHEYEKAMVKMLEVSKSMDALKQMAPQITSKIKELAVPDVPEAFWKEMDAEIEQMFGRMIKEMIPVYQKYLSLDDVTKIR